MLASLFLSFLRSDADDRCKPCVNELWKQEVRSVQIFVSLLGPDRRCEHHAENLTNSDVGTNVIPKAKSHLIRNLRMKSSQGIEALPKLKFLSFRKHLST